jgi:hypothetical protein
MEKIFKRILFVLQKVRKIKMIETTILTVHGHLIDLCGVVLLNIAEDTNVVVLDKVDGHTL